MRDVGGGGRREAASNTLKIPGYFGDASHIVSPEMTGSRNVALTT